MRKFYNYTYYIQINLSSINGMSIRLDSQNPMQFENLPDMEMLKAQHINIIEEREESKEEDSNNDWILFDDTSKEKNKDQEIDEIFRDKQKQLQPENQSSIISKPLSEDGKPHPQSQFRMSFDGSGGIQKKYSQSIASVFFRFSHRDRKNQLITNQEQKEIVDNIFNTLEEHIKRIQEKDTKEFRLSISPGGISSRTCLNFYDPVTGLGEELTSPSQVENQGEFTTKSYSAKPMQEKDDHTFKFLNPIQKSQTVIDKIPLKKS